MRSRPARRRSGTNGAGLDLKEFGLLVDYCLSRDDDAAPPPRLSDKEKRRIYEHMCSADKSGAELLDQLRPFLRLIVHRRLRLVHQLSMLRLLLA